MGAGAGVTITTRAARRNTRVRLCEERLEGCVKTSFFFLKTYQHSHIEYELKSRSVPKGCFQLNGPCYRAVNLLSSLDVSEEFRKWDGPTSALGRGLERGTVKFDSETSRTGFFAKVR